MAKRREEKAPSSEVFRYVHIDEFLASRPDIPEEDKQGFRIWMQGRTYQHSFEDFEDELKNFYHRDR